MRRITLATLAMVVLVASAALWHVNLGDAQSMVAGTYNARVQDGNGVKIPLGPAAKAASLPVTLPTDQATLAAPLGVRLSDGSVALIGQQAMSASIPVVIANNQGAIPTIPGSATAILAGQMAVTATATALPSNAVKGVCVKALIGNGLIVYTGPTGITTSTGDELAAGDGRCYPVNNTNLLFFVSSSTGSSVSWSAWN